MPTPPRVDFAGAIHHVVTRGNRRSPVFRDEVDYLVFLHLFARVASEHAWICLAYCLMPNHYHLLLQMNEPNLSHGMQQLNGTFARRFNRRHSLQDHLFRARFRSVVVEREGHGREASRYIVLNPVRARLCSQPEHWPWSSYAATAGIQSAPPFLTSSALLAEFSSNPRQARELYRRFVADPLSPAAFLPAFAAELDGAAA